MHESNKPSKLAKVSVIIPSVLRPSLIRAVKSVKNQNYNGQLECIIIIDLAEESHSLPHEVIALADLILWTGGGARGGGARNLGISYSTGDMIAFLDDDDEWVPEKIKSQVNLSMKYNANLVISCRIQHRRKGSDYVSMPLPKRLVGKIANQSIEEYLFLRREPSVARASLYTSTLMVSSNLAKSTPWREDLARHQDWDWLMQLQGAGATFLSTESVGTIIWLNSEGSISASSDWISSLDWIERWRDSIIPQVFADFAAAQPLRYALNARSFTGIKEVIMAILRSKKIPSIGTIIIGLMGLLPRRFIAILMTNQK